MAGKRKAAKIKHERAPEIKKQRTPDGEKFSTQSFALCSEEVLQQAQQELNDLLGFKFPDFTCGEQMGAFALAIIKNDMPEHGLSWLAKYYADMLTKLTLERIEDYLGVLLSAALLDSQRSIDIVKTTKRIAYVANNDILQITPDTIKAHIAEIPTLNIQEMIVSEWTTAQSMQRRLVFSIQRFSIHSADDTSINLESCQKLWKQVREKVRAGASIQDLMSIHTGIPTSDFKKLFMQIQNRLESSKEWFSFATKELSELAERVPQIGNLNFDHFIADTRHQMYEEEQGYGYEEATLDLSIATDYLEECVNGYSNLKDMVMSYHRRAAFIRKCHIELLEDEEVVQNGRW